MEGGAGGCGAFLIGAGGVATASSSSAAFDAADDDGVEVGRATGSTFPCKYLSIHCSRSAAAAPAAAADDEGAAAAAAAAAAADDDDDDDDDVVIVFARCTCQPKCYKNTLMEGDGVHSERPRRPLPPSLSPYKI
jgi:hypothetical protein